MNNGKILLIRTAVKPRRGANNEKIILIAAVRIAFSFGKKLKNYVLFGLYDFVQILLVCGTIL